jgi:hypothetical protein
MIVAGGVADIQWSENRWIFFDIGFSNKRLSFGLAFGNEPPECFQFGQARDEILERIKVSPTNINLLIEAPLSICFDAKGNPKGRTIEREDAKHRYWYENLGCGVMVAAIYLVRAIYNLNPGCKVRLFEGFVSFKDREVGSKHRDDVCSLRNVVRDPIGFLTAFFRPKS